MSVHVEPVCKPTDPSFHAFSVEAALVALKASRHGLDPVEANQRLMEHGRNELPPAPRRHGLLRFLAHFHNVLIYVLLGSAVITATMGHTVDTAVILAVVLANALIGFIQEGRAEAAMAAIMEMLAPTTAVLRQGRRQTVAAGELVPGDIVLLEAGDRVPADVRLIEARGLRAEEAILTGESVPVDKTIDAVGNDAALGDRTCLLYSGTLLASGAGRAVVFATGSATQIGQITTMLSEVQTLRTPLVGQMDIFARWLSFFILLVAACLLIYGHYVGHLPFSALFMAVVGLSVAAIPEGLPAVLTITLATGVRAMARRKAIVRRLPAIETLGSVSVICSDKTGTLTRNEMMAVSLVGAHAAFEITGEGYAPEGDVSAVRAPGNDEDDAALAGIGQVAALCNDAMLHSTEGRWTVEGDPMEGALLALAGKISASVGLTFSHWVRTDAIPFDAAHRYMAVLCHDHAGNAVILLKGAPEVVLDLCANQRSGHGTEPLLVARWQEQIEVLAARGQRVIACAIRAVAPDKTVLNATDIEGKLTFIGLVGLIDPPRAEAISAVAECQAAGIRVKMITGDHAVTAGAIAASVGIAQSARVLTGAELDAMDDSRLATEVLAVDVFARTSPAHKLRLVTALQSRGLVVAMTGDGVNDAPALKRADAGVAMGLRGSAAAREASDLVLADDNFASIAAAVREGRTVYDNIRKVIGWTLPTNAGEALVIMVALLAGSTLPVTAVQILWVNLITGITLGLALAFEPTEPLTMLRPPRPRDQPLLTPGLIWHVVLVSVLFLTAVLGIHTYAIDRGYPEALAQTLAMNTLVVLEIFHLFFIRNLHGPSLTWAAARGTPVVWACVLTIIVAQFAVTYVPALQTILGTIAVPLADGLLVVGVGVVFFALIEAEKQMRLSLGQPSVPESCR